MSEPKKPSKASKKSQQFVRFIVKVCAHKGHRAQLRRADNPDTQSDAWPFLMRFSQDAAPGSKDSYIDLEKAHQREAYALIGASVAKMVNQLVDKKTQDFSEEFITQLSQGSLNLGAALALAHNNKTPAFDLSTDNDSPQIARLRRLLACGSSLELCGQLRPVLSLVLARVIKPGKIVDFAQLLDDILYFNYEERQLKSKARWTQHFYRKPQASTEGERK